MKIVNYSRVFLTRSGIGLKRLRLIEETIHQYKGKRKGFYKYALLQFFLRDKIKLTGKYFVVHNHWCPGYYHWLTEAIPRLLKTRDLQDHVLVLPESFKENLYDSVIPLYKGKVFWIPQNKNLKIEHLTIPENPVVSGAYDRATFSTLRDIYTSDPNCRIERSVSSKIYISRAKAGKRKVVNEAEVVTMLNADGFRTVYFEELTFWDQVSIMHHADVVVSIHGAGLTNMLFMKENNYVIELQKAPSSDQQPDVLYKDFSEILRIKYTVQFCKPVVENATLYNADIVVDLNLLKNLLSSTEDR